MKIQQKRQPSKGPLISLIPFSGHMIRLHCPCNHPLPIPDLFQQRYVFVISKLASSWTWDVHDVGVGGHQDNSEWVLQLATEGWGCGTNRFRGGSSFPAASTPQALQGARASGHTVSPGGYATCLQTWGPHIRCAVWPLGQVNEMSLLSGLREGGWKWIRADPEYEAVSQLFLWTVPLHGEGRSNLWPGGAHYEPQRACMVRGDLNSDHRVPIMNRREPPACSSTTEVTQERSSCHLLL